MARTRRRRVLVDSNVLLDVVTESDWSDWSVRALAEARRSSRLTINPIVYAEISAGFGDPDEVDRAFPSRRFSRLDLPWEAAFLASRAFLAYRRAGGLRRSPLPDFYIGAHALVDAMPLLTRDAGRYCTYFPTLELIAP